MVYVQLLVTVCAGCGGELRFWYVTALLTAPLFYVPVAAAQTFGRRRDGRMNFIGFRYWFDIWVNYLMAMQVQRPVASS